MLQEPSPDAEKDPSVPQAEVTQLLSRVQEGDSGAVEALLPLVYDELRGLARYVFDGQSGSDSHTLQPTALVHEAFLKLTGNLDSIEGRRHFFALAARAMRQVLTDHARAKLTTKRGGGMQRVTLHPDLAQTEEAEVEIVNLDASMQRLEEINPRHAKVLEMRLFGGLSVEETAAVLGVSKRTVVGDWGLARTWLQMDLERA